MVGVCRLTKCCCCTLKTGSIITGALLLAFSGCGCAVDIYLLYNFGNGLVNIDPLIDLALLVVCAIGAFLFLINMIINCVLVYGAKKACRSHLRSWLRSFIPINLIIFIDQVAKMCLLTIFVYHNNYKRLEDEFISMVVVMTLFVVTLEALKIYFFVVVRSHYKQLKAISTPNTGHLLTETLSVPFAK